MSITWFACVRWQCLTPRLVINMWYIKSYNLYIYPSLYIINHICCVLSPQQQQDVTQNLPVIYGKVLK